VSLAHALEEFPEAVVSLEFVSLLNGGRTIGTA
jgi:hypothetical protein